MEKDYTIAEARLDLSAIVREVERKKPDWGVAALDTRGFKFDRDEANRR